MKTPILDLFLPRTCPVCGRRLLRHECGLCIYCLADLPQTFLWERTHNPMADRFNAMVQREVRPGTFEPYAYAAALFRFSSQARYRRIPYALKYEGDLPAGRFFAAILARHLAGAPHFADVDAVVPVPLHWTRRYRRGYNQAEVIAREIAAVLGVWYGPRTLRRRRRTGTQTRKSVRDKAENVAGAFAVREGLPEKVRHVLLVDDVFTTGATLNACYRALRTAFPSVRISVATLATLVA